MAVLTSPSQPPRTSRAGKRRKQVSTIPLAGDQRITLACRLDRNADLLLSLNCHVAAERLSLRAQTLREAGASA